MTTRIETEDVVELQPCPFCQTVLSDYITHRLQERYWKHPLSGCVLSRFVVAPDEIAAWNTRSATPIERLREENARVVGAATALIADVRRRYPGEELRCEYMRALDAALTPSADDDK